MMAERRVELAHIYTIPRPMISLSTIAAVDAFTHENGATEVFAGSHRWGADWRENLPGQKALALEMPEGACVVFAGTLVHRGGANRSSAPRLAFSNQYCQPWARQQENFMLGVPPRGGQSDAAAPPGNARLLDLSPVHGAADGEPSGEGARSRLCEPGKRAGRCRRGAAPRVNDRVACVMPTGGEP